MAGTVTAVEQTSVGTVKRLKLTWVSSAGGAADYTTTVPFDGDLICASFIPDGGGTQPSNLYDVTLADSDGVDVLNGLGANLSNAATVNKLKSDGLLAVAGSTLVLSVTNGGNAKGGVVRLLLR